MKNLFFLLFVSFCLTLFACKKDDGNPMKFSFLFFSREVKTIWVDYSVLIPVAEVDGVMGYAIEDFTGESIKSNLFLLGLYTSNVVYDTVQIEKAIKEFFTGRDELIADWPPELTHYAPIRLFQSYYFANNFTDPPELNMEHKINESYTKNANTNSTRSKGQDNSPPQMFQDYRLTEIKNINITSNKTLFGVEPGNSLNQYFQIYGLDPACIFSGNKQLAVDHAQLPAELNEGLSINKWLSFSPLSATRFYFKFTAVPPGLPLEDVYFDISIETSDGETITNSGKPVKLSN